MDHFGRGRAIKSGAGRRRVPCGFDKIRKIPLISFKK
jgi:hypothetical protein